VKEMKLFFGIVLTFGGLLFCFTGIGAIFGIPLLVIGIILLVSWRQQKVKETIKEAAKEFGKGFKEGTSEGDKK
jgi:predicted PurR-regulated permease PerM